MSRLICSHKCINCQDRCRLRNDTCALYAVEPPIGYKLVTPVCPLHLSRLAAECYEEEVKKHEGVCPVCLNELKDIPSWQLAKVSCCKQFICKECFKQCRIKCPLCKNRLYLDMESDEYILHIASITPIGYTKEEYIKYVLDTVKKVCDDKFSNLERLSNHIDNLTNGLYEYIKYGPEFSAVFSNKRKQLQNEYNMVMMSGFGLESPTFIKLVTPESNIEHNK